MKVVVIYDAGSEDWSAQDVAAVLENIREVREVRRKNVRLRVEGAPDENLQAARHLGSD